MKRVVWYKYYIILDERSITLCSNYYVYLVAFWIILMLLNKDLMSILTYANTFDQADR